jgi:hypothetical protein
MVKNDPVNTVDLLGLAGEKGAELLMKCRKPDCREDEKVSIWICKRKLSGANGPWPKIGPLSHSFVACLDPNTTPPEKMFGHAFGKQPRPNNHQSPFYGPGYIEAEPLEYLQQPHEFDDCREKKVCPKDKDRMCSGEGPSQSPYFLFSPFHNCHAWANGRCK